MDTKRAMNEIVLRLDPTPQNGRNSEGAFVTLGNGSLLFAYSKYVTGDHEDYAPSVIAARFSHDGGRTWSTHDRVLVDRGDKQFMMSVSLLRLANGRIALLSAQKNPLGEGLACTPHLRFSDDEMETLSPPVQVVPMHEYHVFNNDRLVQLSSGRLLIPIAQHRFGIGFSNPGLIFFFYSDDEGQTWAESKSSFYRCFPDGQGWQEPGVVQLQDGRLWAWMRTGWAGGERCGRQWQCFSNDNGITWSEPEESQFVSPYSPLSMKRIPQTGDLLAVWNDHSGRFPTPSYERAQEGGTSWGTHRTPLACAISRDEGKTWEHHYLLEDAPDHGFCYTAIHFVEDAVLLAYCAGEVEGDNVLNRLRMRRISLKELYRGTA